MIVRDLAEGHFAVDDVADASEGENQLEVSRFEWHDGEVCERRAKLYPRKRPGGCDVFRDMFCVPVTIRDKDITR